MNIFLEVVTYLAVGGGLGYVIGRIGHCYVNVWMGNPPWAPHHWIYGAVMIPMGHYFLTGAMGLLVLSFGIGHIISDLKDFWALKFISPDPEGKKTFFYID